MKIPLAMRRPIIRLALSREEVAISIGVSAGSVDQMVMEGVLPPARRWHSRKLWLVSEIEAYLNELPGEQSAYDSWRHEDHARDTPKGVAQPGASSPQRDAQKYTFADFHRSIGFDPATMSETELPRLYREADERRLAQIPSTPLNKREKLALVRLAAFGVGVPALQSNIKDCGIGTEERLVARGFIIARTDETHYRNSTYTLTEKGHAWLCRQYATPDL